MEISSRKFNIGEVDVTYKCKSLWKVGGILGHEPKWEHQGSKKRIKIELWGSLIVGGQGQEKKAKKQEGRV